MQYLLYDVVPLNVNWPVAIRIGSLCSYRQWLCDIPHYGAAKSHKSASVGKCTQEETAQRFWRHMDWLPLLSESTRRATFLFLYLRRVSSPTPGRQRASSRVLGLGKGEGEDVIQETC
jgi:hypothetical protein